MTTVQIPQEFFDFCLYLHQDSKEVYGETIEKIITGALRHMDVKRRLTLKKFIDELLAGGYSDADLVKIYGSTDAELGIHDGGMRNFLSMVRSTIARNT